MTKKTETRVRLIVALLGQFNKYITALEEYDSKSFPNGVTRTDEATLDDFAHYLAKEMGGSELNDGSTRTPKDILRMHGWTEEPEVHRITD